MGKENERRTKPEVILAVLQSCKKSLAASTDECKIVLCRQEPWAVFASPALVKRHTRMQHYTCLMGACPEQAECSPCALCRDTSSPSPFLANSHTVYHLILLMKRPQGNQSQKWSSTGKTLPPLFQSICWRCFTIFDSKGLFSHQKLRAGCYHM